jgi:hypothetical protein
MIVDAGKPERGAACFKPQPLVYEHLNSFTSEQVRYHLGVGPMVVVSETRERAEFSPQRSKYFSDRRDVFPLVRNVVARKSAKVGFKAICEFDCSFYVVKAREWAVMRVRKVDDAETVKLLGKTLELDRDLLQREAVRLVQRMFGDTRKVAGQKPQRTVGTRHIIEALS